MPVAEPRSPDENELIHALLARQPDALEWAVRQYGGAMLAAARALVGDVAEDVVQESWLAALKALPEFEGRSKLKTWLITITLNRARNVLRSRRREVSLEGLSDTHPFADRFTPGGRWAQPLASHTDASPEAILGEQELRNCLDKHLVMLPEAQQLAVMLRDQQGLEINEICNLLDVSVSNAKVLIHRGRLRLLRMVEHFQETGEC